LIPRVSATLADVSERRLRSAGWFALLLGVGVQLAAQSAPTITPDASLYPAIAQARPRGISGVTVSRPFFNPALGQKVTIAFSIGRPGTVEVNILDSQRVTIRRILTRSKALPGSIRLDWNGRDEKGIPLPDGVYSLSIKLGWGGGSETYSPGALPPDEWIVYGATYDRRTAVIGYQLSKPASVLLTAQAFSARSAASATPDVLTKIVANWEPRVAGSVIEQWNGLDESGRVYLPEQAKFLFMIKARALPENAVITVGNRIALPVARARGEEGGRR
jgi:hypothetical protein